MNVSRRAMPFLILLLWAVPIQAQVTEVAVAITPTCPHGLSVCWGGAYAALGRLDGVVSVTQTPDAYNSMADLRLNHQGLPDVLAWKKSSCPTPTGYITFVASRSPFEHWSRKSTTIWSCALRMSKNA